MKTLKKIALLALLLVATLSPCVVFATATSSPLAATESREELLVLQAYVAWQRINDARHDPLAVVSRLGIPVDEARAALGESAWILEDGLPPLAWDGQLALAATAHGSDMFARLYYSHVTPEGLGPQERVAAAGYQAILEDETLGALFFDSYVDMEQAVGFMIDTMLRDELTATPGVRRNIFSQDLTEVGAAFFAEVVPELVDNPYVYLYVVDFAAPLEARSFLVGAVDPGVKVLYRRYHNGFWDVMPVLPGETIQAPFPKGGAEVVARDMAGSELGSVPVYDNEPGCNRYIDLRGLVSP